MSRKRPRSEDAEERNTEIALFRYALIAPLLFEPLAAGEKEKVLRAIAVKEYPIPHTERRRVSVTTVRRYLKQYQQGGFDALRPKERADKGCPRAFPVEVIERAIVLREEQPNRTTSSLVEILKRDPELELDQPVNTHTLTTHLRSRGKTRRLLGQQGRVYKRFEREHVNSLWQGDAMVGPWLPDPSAAGKKRRAHLFCFLDDHSRLVPHAEFFFEEALPRMERVLKVGILKRGIPKALYVDNGQVYHATQFAVACANLEIRRLHAAPYSPQGKGKQERFFETTRLQFLPEVEKSEISSLADLNEAFWAWLEIIYHQREHSETGQTPLQRYQAGLDQVRPADPEIIRKAFLWEDKRKVQKDGSIKLQGNAYQVDPHLYGRQITLRYDPFDLAQMEIFLEGKSLGVATVIQQGREKHLAVQHLATRPPDPPKPKSSLDYLAALRKEHQEQQRQQAGQLHFARMFEPPVSQDPDPSPQEA